MKLLFSERKELAELTTSLKYVLIAVLHKGKIDHVDFKTRFILPEFCFVKEKQATQLLKEGKLVIS